MPPDVRKEYDVARATLRKSGGEEILSVLQRDMGVSGTHIKATFREIVVNGKKYDSVDAMPPDVRRTYEQAMARVASGGAAVKPPVARAARAIRPPPSEEVERSEEHTSELQSLRQLVCRLLLERKKQRNCV